MKLYELHKLREKEVVSAVGLSPKELAECCFSLSCKEHVEVVVERRGDMLLLNYTDDEDYDIASDLEHIHGKVSVAFGYINGLHDDWLRKCAWCGISISEDLLQELKDKRSTRQKE